MSKRILFLFALVVMFAISCEDSEVKKQDTAASDLQATDLNAKIAPGPGVALSSFTCGGIFGESYGTPNSLYTYPTKTIDVSCAATGATITVYYDAKQLPNRFTIKTAGGTTVASSGGWKGYASYGGPWGPSIYVSATGSFSFTKAAGVTAYYLFVETLTPASGYSPGTDDWSLSAYCTCVPCNPSCPPGFICHNGLCVCTNNCSTSPLSGTYPTINSLYTYAAQPFTISCNAAGATVTVYYNAQNLPNRFTVKTLSGTTLGSSGGWRGYAPYGGPWGPTVSTPVNGSITFTKVAGQNTYNLIVETLTPPNTTYNPNVDTWSASAGCLPN